MGTISDKLMRIINTKEDIRQALISKGMMYLLQYLLRSMRK